MGTRMDTGSAQEELQAAQLCSLSKAPILKRGKGLRWWPQDLAVGGNIQLGFRAQGPVLGWGQPGASNSHLRAQGQSCPGPRRGTGCGDTAARDETEMRCPTFALQPGLVFPTHTRQLLRQVHKHS